MSDCRPIFIGGKSRAFQHGLGRRLNVSLELNYMGYKAKGSKRRCRSFSRLAVAIAGSGTFFMLMVVWWKIFH